MSTITHDDLPYFSQEQWDAIRMMVDTFGNENVLNIIRTHPQDEQIRLVNQFINQLRQAAAAHYETAQKSEETERLQTLREQMQIQQQEIERMRQQAHIEELVREQVKSIVRQAPKNPVKLNVSFFEGKEGQNIAEWFLECSKAIRSLKIEDEIDKVDFVMSYLRGRAKTWAYTQQMNSPDCFPTLGEFFSSLRKVFSPSQSNHTYKIKFLYSKQGNRDLHEYVHELRTCSAAFADNPIDMDTMVKVFIHGLKSGPARHELFRRGSENLNLEQAIEIAFKEDMSHKQAKTDGQNDSKQYRSSHSFGNQHPQGMDGQPMDISNVEVPSIKCYRCGRQGHTNRNCFARTNVQGNKLATNNSPIKRNWSNGGHQQKSFQENKGQKFAGRTESTRIELSSAPQGN